MPYRSIDDPAKLRRVLEATLMVELDLDLPILLRHVVEEARSMTNARFGALGVLNEDRTALDEFITAGLSPEEEDQIGDRPTGRGVLGLLISDPMPLRMPMIGAHNDSVGVPPGHPPMKSFLGVPIKVRDEVYGNLHLTDKEEGGMQKRWKCRWSVYRGERHRAGHQSQIFAASSEVVPGPRVLAAASADPGLCTRQPA